jgi:hypothetical protein
MTPEVDETQIADKSGRPLAIRGVGFAGGSGREIGCGSLIRGADCWTVCAGTGRANVHVTAATPAIARQYRMLVFI